MKERIPVRVWMPIELHSTLKAQAAIERSTLANLILEMLRRAVRIKNNKPQKV